MDWLQRIWREKIEPRPITSIVLALFALIALSNIELLAGFVRLATLGLGIACGVVAATFVRSATLKWVIGISVALAAMALLFQIEPRWVRDNIRQSDGY